MKILSKYDIPGWKLKVEWRDSTDIIDGQPNLHYFFFSSGRIVSKRIFKFGTFRLNFKIPNLGLKPTWPAFWLFGDGQDSYHPEIDFFEFNHDHGDDPFFTLHRWGSNNSHMQCGVSMDCNVNFIDDFHTISTRWTSTDIEWYVDGSSVESFVHNYLVSGQEAGCNLSSPITLLRNDCFPMYGGKLIINDNVNLQMGGGNPFVGLLTPAIFEIDFMEVWQQVPCNEVDIIFPVELSDRYFNVFAGNTIFVDGGIKLGDDDQLTVIANTAIILNPGFECTANSSIEFRIDNSVCIE